MHPADIIARKRAGEELSPEDIEAVVDGVVGGGFGDAQLGAFLMAVCCRGMTVDETTALTCAMRDSGAVLDLSSVPGRKIDKHSTGGVGDKVSLVLAPLVAAAGVPVPMISGRGLGHTGGTLDKLAAIPGYRTALSAREFVDVLGDCGYVMAGQTEELAPADRRMYAVRDVSGTIESIPLITSSILSKKLASGLDGLVMDVKVGRAAFMPERADAEALMQSIVAVGQAAGKHVRALLTDMDAPLGCTAGNALEVEEAIQCLRGEGPADVMEVVLALGAEMLVLGGVAADLDTASAALRQQLASGAGVQRLARNIERQGGDPRVVDDAERLPRAPVVEAILAPHAGFLVDVDPLVIGRAVVDLGGGRRQPEDDVDPRVGVRLLRQLGDVVNQGEPWAEVHAASMADAERGCAAVAGAMTVGETRPAPRRMVLARM